MTEAATPPRPDLHPFDETRFKQLSRHAREAQETVDACAKGLRDANARRDKAVLELRAYLEATSGVDLSR